MKTIALLTLAAVGLAWAGGRDRHPAAPAVAIPLRNIGTPQPTAGDLPPGTWAMFRDSNGDIRLWCNDAGTMIATNPLL